MTSSQKPTPNRRLLLIYIHGFLGNETSFQSFPAHLHNLLTITLPPLSYTVHTKVYPKFQTRRAISVATAAASSWISKFEDEGTDVVLLGHSMGGLLAAEAAMIRGEDGGRRHRVLGIVTFDSPFLGMHPGVVTTGLGSLFRAAPEAGGRGVVDEVFDRRPVRNFTIVEKKEEGTWASAMRFVTKHRSQLTAATGRYLAEHLEFGGCLADPVGLKSRYEAIRALEDGKVMTPGGGVERVRFVNYYTCSTGRGVGSEVLAPAPGAVVPGEGFEIEPGGSHAVGDGEVESHEERPEEVEYPATSDKTVHGDVRGKEKEERPAEEHPIPQKQKHAHKRRFCILPADRSDKCWVEVRMTGVDEVGAHCGLFFLGEVYERLVGDVAGRLEEWVVEERSRRVVEGCE